MEDLIKTILPILMIIIAIVFKIKEQFSDEKVNQEELANLEERRRKIREEIRRAFVEKPQQQEPVEDAEYNPFEPEQKPEPLRTDSEYVSFELSPVQALPPPAKKQIDQPVFNPYATNESIDNAISRLDDISKTFEEAKAKAEQAVKMLQFSYNHSAQNTDQDTYSSLLSDSSVNDRFTRMLREKNDLKTLFIASEIFSTPVSLRKPY